MATIRRQYRDDHGGLVGAIGLLPRRWTSESAVIIPMALTLFVISLLVAATPRLLNQLADRALQQSLARASAEARGVDLVALDRIDPSQGERVLAPIEQRGSEYAANLPPELRGVVTEPAYLVQSPSLLLVDEQGRPLYDASWQYPSIRFTYAAGIETQLKLLEGRLPEPRAPVQPGEPLPGGGLAEQATPLFEIAVTPATAELLRMALHERVLVRPDEEDPLAADVPAALLDVRAVIEVVGIVDPSTPLAASGWNALELLKPGVSRSGEQLYIDAPGLLAPDAYRGLFYFTAPIGWRYTWRHDLLTDQLNAAEVGSLGRALAVLRTFGVASTPGTPASNDITVVTTLDSVLERFQTQERLTNALLLTAAIGAGAVLALLLLLLARLIAERRQPALMLLRSRGAALTQLLIIEGVEAALLIVLAATAGYLTALLIIDARGSALSLLGVVLVSVLALLFVLHSVAAVARAGERGELHGRRRVSGHLSAARQLVGDGLIVLLAGVGVYLLRQRGMAGGAGEGDAIGDPLLAAVPALVALAAAALAIRLYPYPLRALARLAAGMRRLTPFLSLRRAAEPPATFRLTFMAITLALAFGAFVAVVGASVSAAQNRAAWLQVGADYQITSADGTGTVPAGFDVQAVAGVQDALTSYEAADAELGGAALRLIAIDPAAYSSLTAGTPAAPDLPSELSAGPSSAAIPALLVQPGVSSTELTPGQTAVVNVGAAELPVTIVDLRERFPGSTAAGTTLVVPLHLIEGLEVWSSFEPATVYVRGSAQAADGLAARVAEEWPGAAVHSRRAELEAQRDEPFAEGVRSGLRLATLTAAVAAVLALLIATSLAAREQMRDIAYLMVLGLSRRQVAAQIVAEQEPLILAAALTGLVAAVATAYLTLSRFGLEAYIASTLNVRLVLPWDSLGLLIAGLGIVLLGAVAGLLTVLTRVGAARVVRFSD